MQKEAGERPDMTDAREATPAEILTFWREAGRDRWYRRDAAFDAEVRRRYLELWRKAAAGGLCAWEATDDGALALTIVLDQVEGIEDRLMRSLPSAQFLES